MATYSLHWLIMGKVEIGIYCCLLCVWVILFVFFYRNVPWIGFYELYEFCPNRWIWLVAMATGTLNFRNKYSKIFTSEAIRGMKLKICIHVHDISLYMNYVFYCLCLCAFVALANQSFYRLIMGNMDITEMFIEKSSTNRMHFVQSTDFDWLPWQPKGLIKKQYKNLLLRSHKRDEAETM